MRRKVVLAAAALVVAGLGSATSAGAAASEKSVCIAQFLSDRELSGNVGHNLGGRGAGVAPTIGGVGQVLGAGGSGLAASNCGTR